MCTSESIRLLLWLLADNRWWRWSHCNMHPCARWSISSHVSRLQRHVSPVTVSHVVSQSRWRERVSEGL